MDHWTAKFMVDSRQRELRAEAESERLAGDRRRAVHVAGGVWCAARRSMSRLVGRSRPSRRSAVAEAPRVHVRPDPAWYMRPRFSALAAAAVLIAALAVPAPAAAAESSALRSDGALRARVVVTLPAGPFDESMAIDRAGNRFVSTTTWGAGWNQGQMLKITPAGQVTPFGPSFDVGILSGLAFGEDGHLYAGFAAWSDPNLPVLQGGVLRYDADGSVTRVATIPAVDGAGFANGLAFHDGYLYVSDSSYGAIWRFRPHCGTDVQLTTPWLRDPTLAFNPETGWEGVNGIAFWGDTLYAVNADSGTVVRVPVSRSGAAGKPTVVASDPGLIGADGVAFDAHGGLWIAVNHANELVGGALYRYATGGLQTIANDPGWLDYPAQPVFGIAAHDRTTLYVVNGSINTGNGNIVALKVGVAGEPLR